MARPIEEIEAELDRENFAHIHPSVTPDRVAELVERELISLDNPGVCLGCGEEADGCEPDACRYRCEACGEMKVYGAQEVLLRIIP